jgi:hypothetical protein
MRVCPSWLNLLHNINPHLEILGGSVSFQYGINIFFLFIYKLYQQLIYIVVLIYSTLTNLKLDTLKLKLASALTTHNHVYLP